MSSVLRRVRKRKKARRLGRVDVMRREDYAELDLDPKVELIRSLVPLGLMHVEEWLDEEVTAPAARCARKAGAIEGRRHGHNPGTVGLAGQRVSIRVPRIRRVAGSEIPLRSYAALHGDCAVNDLLLTRVLYGISCRNYEAAAEVIRARLGCQGRRCPGASSKPARRSSASSKSGTSLARMSWPWSWTVRRSPMPRW